MPRAKPRVMLRSMLAVLVLALAVGPAFAQGKKKSKP
jgi:hypothetical protein